ncbi:MAG: cyclic nucleotide-binding domain-containing protein [Stappiaceae bacterium]
MGYLNRVETHNHAISANLLTDHGDGHEGIDVLPRAKANSFEAHDVVFHEGDDARRVYELTSGTVMLYKLLPDGRRQVVEILRQGDLFGMPSGDLHDCTAETLTDVEVRSVARREIETSAEVQAFVTKSLIAQMESLHDHAVLLGRKSAIERVTTFIMRLIPNRGNAVCTGPTAQPDQCRVVLSMTRQEIADYLGLTIETVSRVISELKRRGLVKAEKQDRLIVTNTCAVCRLTGMH